MKNHVFTFLLVVFSIPLLGQSINHDFEGNDLSLWQQIPESRWEITTANTIGGAFSLKHSPTSGSDKDRISIDLPSWDGDQGSVIWRFRLRHRFNPSGSNNWGVFLSADADANGMVAGTGVNGYVVGVNLTSTDDLLRLYKIKNGSFSPIITSALNWETQIGSTLLSVGAVEVERKPDGTFILKCAIDGKYASLQNYGSAPDNEFGFGGHFGVYYSYTTSAAGLLMVDDISFTYKPVNPNDRLADVIEPDQQVEGGVISSMSTTQDLALDLFRFKIVEQGSTDGLWVRPTRFVFSKIELENAFDWQETIAGVVLKANGVPLQLGDVYIRENSIEIYVDDELVAVDDNGTKDFTFGIYLKNEGLVDGSTIQLKISNEEHGWETDFNGSDFKETFSQVISSNVFTISVTPTHLSLVEYPNPIVVNKPFTVVAYVSDANGNLATSFSGGEIFLGLKSGGGLLAPSENLVTSAINGVITWDDITYSLRDDLSLMASGSELVQAQTETINTVYESTSIVVGPLEQMTGRSIPSNLNTLGKAVEVFRFGIADLGEFDGLHTIVRQIFIRRPTGLNLSSYSGSIGGVLLKANNQVLPIGNPHILTASISIPIPEGALVVPNGDTLEIALWVYLKSSGLADGTNLRFAIDAENSGFVASDNGSTFASAFPQPVASNAFTVDVNATRLNFSEIPQYVGFDNFFTVEVSAVDEGGSVDVHATGSITLSKNLGDGWLSIPGPTATLSGGKAIWDSLAYSYFNPDPFNLLASTASYNDITSPLVYCSDRTTTIQPPTVPLEDGEVNSLAVSRETAVEVFRLSIVDRGTTDNLPTRITQMVFHSQQQSADVNLSKTIEGVALLVNGVEVGASNVSISANSITLQLGEDDLVVPDGEIADISLLIYLKKGVAVDGSTISLFIPQSGHGWQTSLLGSGFPITFESGIVGSTFTVSVYGTSLRFVDQPFITDLSNSYLFTATLTDTYGSIDLESTGIVELSLDYGAGGYTVSPTSASLNHGIAQWENVNMSSIGKYRFIATSNDATIAQAYSEPIWNGSALDVKIDEDFEVDMLSFALTSHWGVSTVSPIDGEASLKHALSGVGGESQLAIPLQINNLGDGPMEWQFTMRNGSWDPSSDNAFWFVLASDGESIKLGEFNGYAVGVNLSGTSDLLTLWRVTRGQPSQVVIESVYDWDEAETVAVRVTRTPDGIWSLWYKPQITSSKSILAGQVVDRTHQKALYCGPVFKYTASRAGEFWLDNLMVSSTQYPPVIQSSRLLTLTSVDISFSSALNKNDASVASHYIIEDQQGKRYSVLGAHPSESETTCVTLRTEQLPLERLKLRIAGVRSASGGVTVNDSTVIGLGAIGTFGNVVINEIMARPSPVVGLPNVEFIELYNRTSLPISLKGWRIRGNSNFVTIPDATVEPNGYIILSGTSGASQMAHYGNAVGVSSFPTLLVGGMFLGLYDENNNLISWVEYSDTWYKDDMKKAGGYSLERIDPNNLVEGAQNWTASSDTSGGTPGKENSVAKVNPDNISPVITEVKVVSPTELELGFSEPMDSLSITLVSNYSIDRGIGSPIWATTAGPKYDRVTLTFAQKLVPREIYNLCFQTSIVDFSGNAIETSCLYVALPEEPSPLDVVINEVLFNPYTGGVDFVEIYNRSDKTFDLSKLWIANRNRTTLGLSEFYRASESSWLMLPNSYVVLTENPQLVEQFYLVESPDAMVNTRQMPAYPNDGGYVLLLADLGEEIDEFAYTDRMHNTLLADVKGVSLERIHPDMPTNDPSSWQSAAQTAGFATPTAQNSQYADPTQVEDEFTLSHQVFSPDGDGFEDYVMISYELPDPGYIANIMVFDSRGRRVKRLAANLTLGTSGSIKWDGTNDAGARATIGAYVIFIEAFDLKGNIKRYKRTVVVAARLR